jgi:hypothetical protein
MQDLPQRRATPTLSSGGFAMNVKQLERNFDLIAYLKTADPEAKEYGPNTAIRDPICGKHDKLWVLTVDKANGTKAGAYVCYFCNEGGYRILDLIQRLEDCSRKQAFEVLLSHQTGKTRNVSLRMLVKDLMGEPDEVVEKPMPVVALPAEFIEYGTRRKAHPYFAYRKVTFKRARRYHLGYCTQGYFKNRLVVPVSLNHQHLFFVARYMNRKVPAGIKKTLYPKGSRPNRVLFNFDVARHQKRIILVEDVFSAMNVGKEAVATLGTQFSSYQLELLLQARAEEVVIMWDLDAIDKAHQLAAKLAEFWTVRVVRLPDVRDPDELDRATIRDLIAQAPILDHASTFARIVRSKLGQ